MCVMLDMPPAMEQEAKDFATVQGITLERMLLDCLKRELARRKETEDVYDYLMSQQGWLPKDYEFDREEANAR